MFGMILQRCTKKFYRRHERRESQRAVQEATQRLAGGWEEAPEIGRNAPLVAVARDRKKQKGRRL